MIYRVLGELEISQDNQFLDLPGGHTLIVLAALLINTNQRLSKTQLLQAAWGSAEVSEAQLHKSAGALRALLVQIGRERDLVTHTRYGYARALAALDRAHEEPGHDGEARITWSRSSASVTTWPYLTRTASITHPQAHQGYSAARSKYRPVMAWTARRPAETLTVPL